jgi:hypothetical protein
MEGSASLERPRIEAPPKPPDRIDAMIKLGDRRGREFIVDELGSVRLAIAEALAKGPIDESPFPLRVLGAPGRWTVESTRGATVSAQRGTIPGAITVTPSPGRLIDYDVTLRDASGARFSSSRYFVPIDWQIRFFTN